MIVRPRPLHRLSAAPALLAAVLALSGCGVLDAINPFSGSKNRPPDPSSLSAEQLYNDGVTKLRAHRYDVAVASFEEVQNNYPYSPWATNAQLMEGYANYENDAYSDAVTQLEHFIQLHPTSADTPYAYYLRALCFYQQIADIQRDQRGTVQAMAALGEVVNRYPRQPLRPRR